MLVFALYAAVAYGAVKPDTGKCGPVPCLFTGGGLHAIYSDQVPFNEAQAACAQFGWQLADVTASNQLWAQSVVKECYGGKSQAWIQSYNGLTGEPCMVANGMGFAGVSECWSSDQSPLILPVLCQEPQVITTTKLGLTTWPVTQGVRTVTATTSVWASETRRPHNRPFHPDSDLQDFRLKSGCPVDGGCGRVCPFQYPTLRILMTDHVSYGQADSLCRKHGWRLASLSTGSLDKAFDLFDLCQSNYDNLQSPPILWANSYNGVASPTCNLISKSSFLFAMTAEVCGFVHEESEAWVLCQTEGPSGDAEASGPWKAATVTTTVSTSSTVMLVIPSATTTVTVTETMHCRKGHCRPLH